MNRKVARWLVLALLTCGLIGLNLPALLLPPVLELKIHVAIPAPIKTAGVYYDVGKAVWPMATPETDDAPPLRVAMHNTRAGYWLSFSLPTPAINRIQVVGTLPFEVDDAAVVLKATNREVGQVDVVPELRSTEGKVSVAESARLLKVRISGPVRYTLQELAGRVVTPWTLVVLAAGVLVILAWNYIADRLFAPTRARIQGSIARWAERLRQPDIFELNSGGMGFIVICFVTFGALAIAGVHGSSASIWARYPFCDVAHKPLIGQPHPIRSDEWTFHTVAMLNQAFRADRFSPNDASVGPGKTALFANIPCNHLLELFRPQFWAFHFLSFDAAYAWYWQAKGLFLLLGVFVFLLMLTRSNTISIIGSLWFCFSAFTQWTYSWPSLLPEMVGLLGLVVTAVAYLLIGRGFYSLCAAAILASFCAINFALCFYPPHQLPLGIFGAVTLCWWVWTYRVRVFSGRDLYQRLTALFICCGIVVMALVYFYFETHSMLAVAAGTIYPGRRACSGGGVTVTQLMSHFLDFWKRENSFPPMLGNICEGTGYLWLAPVTLFFARRGSDRDAVRAGTVWTLWLSFSLIAAWMLLPIPASVGRWIGFDKVIPNRCLPALGLINVAIVSVFLARTQRAWASGKGRNYLIIILAVLTVVGGSMFFANVALAQFFSRATVCLASLYTALLILLLVFRRLILFSVALLGPLFVQNAFINPVDRGFAPIEQSTVFRFAQAHPELKDGKWLVYSAGVELPSFLSAAGLQVVDTLKIIPDLNLMASFDPTGVNRDIYNRSGWTLVTPEPRGEPSHFASPVLGTMKWDVSPLDPSLKKAGFRYIAFATPPENDVVKGLVPIESHEFNGVWLYKIP